MINYHLSHLRDLFGEKGTQRGHVQLHTKGLLNLYADGVLIIGEPSYKAFKIITERLMKHQRARMEKECIGNIEYQILYFALKAIIDESNPSS